MTFNITICESDTHFKTSIVEQLQRLTTFILGDSYNNGYDLINRIHYKQNNVFLINATTPIITGTQTIKLLREKEETSPIIIYSNIYQEDVFNQISNFNDVYYCQRNSNIILQILTNDILNRSNFYLTYLPKWKQNQQDVNDYKTRTHDIMQRLIWRQLNPYTPTVTEVHILNYACNGLTNKEIASKLQLSHRTIDSYIKKLTEKFKVKNKTQLVIYCLEQNLLKTQITI